VFQGQVGDCCRMYLYELLLGVFVRLKIEMHCAAGRRNEPLYAGVEETSEGDLQKGSCTQRKRRRCQSRYHPDVWSEEETTVSALCV
jgi:hypothetical protein